jgi:hypothetical protein
MRPNLAPADATPLWQQLLLPTNAIEFWTLVLTVATVALGIVAYFGLRSVGLSKKDMRNRAARDETQCAVDRCNEMCRSLLPMFSDILRDLSAKQIPVFVRQTAEVSLNPALASEAVAFEPCSTVFGQMVMVLYGSLLTQRRANPASGPYQHVVTLFQGWYAKSSQDAMLAQINRLQEDRSRLPPTIGKNLDSAAKRW